ncbi:MAG TPA: hypothetical protein VNG13_06050 [Mycobacteriales bacterium]|nr:hypothetical protein [Mycobacteriales bacterium]
MTACLRPGSPVGWVRNRLPTGGRDDTGSIMLVFFVLLVAVALSTIVLAVVLNQALATRLDGKRVHTLHAAEAGLDVALGQIRAATTGGGSGVLSELPCGPLSGAVDAAGSASYQVTVTYYGEDPSGQSPSWLASNQIPCSPGAGPAAVAGYARIVSAGSSAAASGFSPATGNRTLQTVYVFQTTNANIPGGEIAIYNDGNPGYQPLCFDAGSADPAPGALLQVQPCSTSSPPAASQVFAYQSDLSIVLSSTESLTQPMCLDGPYSGGSHTSGEDVVFQPCTGVEVGGTVTPEQQFAYNDVGGYQTATDYSNRSNANVDNFCLMLQSYDTPSSNVVLATGSRSNPRQSFDACGGPFNGSTTWNPATSVGAGDADTSPGTLSSTPQQIVNYAQFGRCIDLTNATVTDNGPPSQTTWGNGGFFILYPCKQNPNPANVRWNQKLAASPSGYTNELVMTDGSGQPYCLISPLTSTGAEATIATMQPPYPNSTTTGACAPGPVSATSNQQYDWTYTGNTGDYRTSYQLQDANGNCLDIGPQQTPPGSTAPWSTLVVDPCTSSLNEKWQAPPNLIPSQLVNTQEQ